NNDNEDTGFQKRGPFRLGSQLKALAINLARVHQRSVITEHEMELVSRVAMSTIPPYRASVLALFQKSMNLTPKGGLTVTACAKASVPKTTAQDRLTELVELTILTKDASAKEHEYKPLPEFVD